MEYINSETGVKINLDSLTPEEKKFYERALKKFQANTEWVSFDDFALGMRSPIFKRQGTRIEAPDSALYFALKDMSIQLGVQQGLIARVKKQKKRVA